ncbi:MAG: hypothetical protein D4R79_17800 [Comamonadaceae bacterium]|nr:MAG: hypothetical protein D4R79_17800 [Comamonadaceae bacterium]
MKNPATLSELRNHLCQVAEKRWLWSLYLAAIALFVAVGAAFSQQLWVGGTAGLVGVILPLAVAWLRETASGELLQCDKCRRLILYADGLGHDIPASQLLGVRAWGLGASLGPAPFTPPYYASKLPVGPRRLADIITESAFFTRALAGKVQFVLWIVVGVGVVAAVSALLLSDFAKGSSSDSVLAVAKSIGLFVAFLISGDTALLAKKYGDLERAAHLTFDRCARLRDEAAPSSEDVRAVAEDYGVALLQCPPIPSRLYLLYRDSLNDLYRDSHDWVA